MTETLHFTYKSIGNFCFLLLTIDYENTHTPREISVFHQRFKISDETDNFIEQCLNILFPDGANIGMKEIKQLTSYIENFMMHDTKSKYLFAEYDKSKYPYYVYFKPDIKVYECEFAQHSKVVEDICCDYFKNFDEIDPQYIKRFIIDNFEISSDNSTVESISRDYMYITREILFRNRKMKLAGEKK